MARFSRLEVLNELLRIGALPLFFERNVNAARK